MPDFETVNTPDGWSVWCAVWEANCETTCYGVYVISDQEFGFVRYEERADQREAVEQLQAQKAPDKAFGKTGKSIPLRDIVQVENPPGKDAAFAHLWVKCRRQEKIRTEVVACPQDMAKELFRSLRQRLKPRLRQREEPVPLFRAALNPLVGLVGTWLIFIIPLYFAAVFSPPPPPTVILGGREIDARPPNAPPEYESKYAAAVRGFGGWLGTRGVVTFAIVANLGLVTWLAIALVARPKQKVLRERSPDSSRDP